jgi:ligand-binding sensor domain-containing protein
MQEHIGRRLGVYQIVERIGRGGMATVYKAYQPSVDRYVAIKILPSHLTEDESFVGRFTQEARTLARLEHPHILPVHDYGEEGGTTYLVMRYVKAGTLKDLISRQGPLELEEVARVMDQVGRALDYAHSQNVVHRDIKPSNILIDQQGNTFLTDFGIAKLVAETAQFTASGAIIGTPAYMSPEQSMGQPADYRCDIYSLGVVLYELVTGQLPFEAETPLAVLLKHINDPLPLPRLIKEDLPEAVERVILKATAKAPEDRFQSVQEMIDALARAVAPRPAEPVPPPAEAVQEATLAWSSDEPVPEVAYETGATPPAAAREAIPSPTVEETPPPPAMEPAPRPAAELAAPPVAEGGTPPGDASIAPPRLVTQAPARIRRRWLPLLGGAAALAVLLVIVFVVWKPFGGESIPAAVSEAQVTPTAVSQATTTTGAAPGQAPASGSWTSYSNGNFVLALARQGDTLWAGGDGGLVRWNLADGGYVKFGREDGLPPGRITDLLVDDGGLLWIATDSGIQRYDGERFTTYGEGDGLDAQQIEALYLDGKGGLWAGSCNGELGLNYYDGEGWGPPPVPPLPADHRNVVAVGGSEQVRLFAGLDDLGVALYDGETWTVLTTADGLLSEQVSGALLTGDALWVSSDEGLSRIDVETHGVETFPQSGIYAMQQAAGGDIWFGGAGRALRYDPDSGDWQEFEATSGGIPARDVTDIVADDNRVWLGTYGGGVAFYDGSQWETWTTEEKLGGNLIEAIRQDRDGVLWFMHPGTGLSRYEPARDTWQMFGQAEGALDWPGIHAVDSDGNVWIGGYGELLRYDGHSWQSFTAPELTGVEIDAIEIGPGDVKWLVTNSGIMRHDPATDEWDTFAGLYDPNTESPPSILAASDGTVWLGMEKGVVRYDGRTWAAPQASGRAPQYVTDLAQAPDGSLWIAADGELGHLANGEWSYYVWPVDRWLERVAVGPDGRVWAGYEGLGCYDPGSGEWQSYTPDDGLVHRLVRSIHVTPEGVVWVGTEGGLSRFVPPD